MEGSRELVRAVGLVCPWPRLLGERQDQPAGGFLASRDGSGLITEIGLNKNRANDAELRKPRGSLPIKPRAGYAPSRTDQTQ